MEEDIIFKTKLSTKGIIITVIGVGMGSFFLLLTQGIMKSNIDVETILIIITIIRVVFLLMVLAPIFMLLNSRIFMLTEKSLIVKKPMLLHRKVILYDDIEKIEQDKYQMTVQDNNSFSVQQYRVYNGMKMVICLKNGRSIKLSSFETGDYKEFAVKFNHQFRLKEKT